MYADKYIHHASDIPEEPHWVILTNTSVHIPGDERSRTNPGHGYPASTKHYIEYKAFLTEEKWKAAINKMENPQFGMKKSYVAMKVYPAEIKHTVEPHIKE